MDTISLAKHDRIVLQLMKEKRELVTACEVAMVWIGKLGEHAPVAFGGEAEIHEMLRAAIAEAKGETVTPA